MFDVIVKILSKSVDVLLQLKRTDRAKWCARLLQALFLLDQFRQQLSRFRQLLGYYIEHGHDPDIEHVVRDLEKMRLHPLSEHMRILAVVINSHYVIKDEELGLSGLCLKYAEREDGIVVEYDDLQWKPGQTPPAKAIIVADEVPFASIRENETAGRFSAKEYLAYLLNRQLRRLVISLRDLIHGWSNTLGIWDDLIDMSQTKILVIDADLHDSLVSALAVEGEFFKNLMMHSQAVFDLQSNHLMVRESFFHEGDPIDIDLSSPAEATLLLQRTTSSLAGLDECAKRLRMFIKNTFELDDILKA